MQFLGFAFTPVVQRHYSGGGVKSNDWLAYCLSNTPAKIIEIG